jgi:hypothetical protein
MSSVQSSVYCRIGLEPMNAQHSMTDAGALRDLDDRRDVGEHGPRRAIGPYRSFAARSRAPAARRPATCGPGAGQADVGVSMPSASMR